MTDDPIPFVPFRGGIYIRPMIELIADTPVLVDDTPGSAWVGSSRNILSDPPSEAELDHYVHTGFLFCD